MEVQNMGDDAFRISLARNLRAMGLGLGAVVLARAAARAIAPGRSGAPQLLLGALLDVVGPSGTVVALTHTQSQVRWQRSEEVAFSPDSPTVSGGFAAAVLAHPDRLRSSHPLDSIAAIGRDAEGIVRNHDRDAKPFSWIASLIELGGVQLLVGCVKSSPGFSSVHFVQEELGLSSRSLMKSLYGCQVHEPDGLSTWFAEEHIPGCSMGFWKAYAHYVRSGLLEVGRIGQAYSVLIPAADAVRIERSILDNDPRAFLCDRVDCVSCGTRTYNLRALPLMVSSQIARIVRKSFR
jgi:aminoglycoside 3-N-acetyltransferase